MLPSTAPPPTRAVENFKNVAPITDPESQKHVHQDSSVSITNATNMAAVATAATTGAVTLSRWTQLRMAPSFLLLTVGLALFVDLMCYSIIMPLTPFLIEDMGMGPAANGVLIACFAAGLLVASLTVGHISDYMASRRTPMLGGLFAIALSTVLFMETMDHY
ncbi:hypothetical protein BGZ72_011156 [Mortierella alpina]|nr:hypothetical protein BGZ72_011156 [Mortierella alpina]